MVDITNSRLALRLLGTIDHALICICIWQNQDHPWKGVLMIALESGSAVVAACRRKHEEMTSEVVHLMTVEQDRKYVGIGRAWDLSTRAMKLWWMMQKEKNVDKTQNTLILGPRGLASSIAKCEDGMRPRGPCLYNCFMFISLVHCGSLTLSESP